MKWKVEFGSSSLEINLRRSFRENSNLLKNPTFRSISRNFHLKFPQDVHFVGCSHRFLGATPTHHLPPLPILPSNSSVVPGTFRTGLSGWGPTTPVKRQPPQVDRVSNWKRPWNSLKISWFFLVEMFTNVLWFELLEITIFICTSRLHGRTVKMQRVGRDRHDCGLAVGSMENNLFACHTSIIIIIFQINSEFKYKFIHVPNLEEPNGEFLYPPFFWRVPFHLFLFPSAFSPAPCSPAWINMFVLGCRRRQIRSLVLERRLGGKVWKKRSLGRSSQPSDPPGGASFVFKISGVNNG